MGIFPVGCVACEWRSFNRHLSSRLECGRKWGVSLCRLSQVVRCGMPFCVAAARRSRSIGGSALAGTGLLGSAPLLEVRGCWAESVRRDGWGMRLHGLRNINRRCVRGQDRGEVTAHPEWQYSTTGVIPTVRAFSSGVRADCRDGTALFCLGAELVRGLGSWSPRSQNRDLGHPCSW